MGIIRFLAVITSCLAVATPCSAQTITVDIDGQADFNAIQAAIDYASSGDTIIVQPGLYNESINFLGKNITLTSTNPANPAIVAATTIAWENQVWPPQVDPAVAFAGTEDETCMLSGFNIDGYVIGCDPQSNPYTADHTHATISYCTLTDNLTDCSQVLFYCDGKISNCLIADNNRAQCVCMCGAIEGCHGLIKNCTIANNNMHIMANGTTTVENCILYNSGIFIEDGGTLNISYSDSELGPIPPGLVNFTVNWGPGNINTDPCFVRPGRLDGPITWFVDYHLKSEGWRWDKDANQWTWDDATSRCIDAGNPSSNLGEEPLTLPVDPLNRCGQNLRIDMGAYGGTAEASMPPYDWAILGDSTNDGVVNFNDYAYLASHWLTSNAELPGDLNRNGNVDINDLSLFTEDWLKQTSWHNQ